MNQNIAIIDYGLGNIFSIKHACEYFGMNAIVTSDKREILTADSIILPGVGAFGDAMHSLQKLDLISPLKELAESGKPFIGICLGMQLLFTESDEFGAHKGLDIIKGKVGLKSGDSLTLPFASETFDKLCSINTLYFWKEPSNYFREMFRVVKHGGTIVIGFRDNVQMSNLNLSKDVFNTYSQDDVATLLMDAGFSGAHIREKQNKPFVSYCAVGTKA